MSNNAAVPYIIGGVVLASALIGGYWAYNKFAPVNDGYVRVEVDFNNTCPVADRFFAVKTTQTRKISSLSGGKTTIIARRDEQLELILDPKYSAVEFSGYKTRVQEKVRLSADCSSSARQKMVIDTMRDQFNE